MAVRRLAALPPLAALALQLSGPAARADIYVWSDAAGIEHYTNSLEGVPEDRRESAKPFVRERPRAAPDPEPVQEIEPEPPVAAEAAEDLNQRLREAYAAGHGDGVASAAPPTVIEVMPAPVVQQAAVFVEAPRTESVIVGSFWPGRDRHRHPHRPPHRHEAAASPFAIGPAGPPPRGAAGPPPFAAPGRGERR